LGGITGSDAAESPPEDIVSLWRAFSGLPRERRTDFLQAGNLYQLGVSPFLRIPTASLACLVAACEALKPGGVEFRDHNAYDVIEALLGKVVADRLRAHPVRPQEVRSVHFHRGEFRGDEFTPRNFASSYDDPTFDDAVRDLYRVASNAIIEWLRNDGRVTLQAVKHATGRARSARGAQDARARRCRR
jgi:hypothetical protein